MSPDPNLSSSVIGPREIITIYTSNLTQNLTLVWVVLVEEGERHAHDAVKVHGYVYDFSGNEPCSSMLRER